MNKNKSLWAVLPHRGVDVGKSRLGAVLSDSERSELNRWLLKRSVRIVGAWLGDAQRCVVVSPCARTLGLAQHAGATPLTESASAPGLNAALAQATEHAAMLGAQRLLILPCDLPRLNTAALQAMMFLSMSDRDVVIAPDRHRSGTNALLIDATAREFAWGENSLNRHIDISQARGLHAVLYEQSALAFDLDTEKDFLEWLHSGAMVPAFLAARSSDGVVSCD
jgi:2-phospho-L-lactate guanylyltransferase